MDNSYERINDLVFILSSEVKLMFSVVLARYAGNDKYRIPYHKEYEYNKNGEKVITVTRCASSMLLFKFNEQPMNDIAILSNHFIKFYNALASCQKWFDGTKQVFCTKQGKIYIQKDNPNRAPIIITELVDNKWISIEPIVILSTNDIYTTGIRICFNNNMTIDMPVDRYYGLLHVLTGFNFYMATSSLLNYINTCTPGTNSSSFNNYMPIEDTEGFVDGVNGRKPITPKKSIFDI